MPFFPCHPLSRTLENNVLYYTSLPVTSSYYNNYMYTLPSPFNVHIVYIYIASIVRELLIFHFEVIQPHVYLFLAAI